MKPFKKVCSTFLCSLSVTPKNVQLATTTRPPWSTFDLSKFSLQPHLTTCLPARAPLWRVTQYVLRFRLRLRCPQGIAKNREKRRKDPYSLYSFSRYRINPQSRTHAAHTESKFTLLRMRSNTSVVPQMIKRDLSGAKPVWAASSYSQRRHWYSRWLRKSANKSGRKICSGYALTQFSFHRGSFD